MGSERVASHDGPEASDHYVGALEDHATLGGAGPNCLEASGRFRDALEAKGYDVAYTEVPGGNHAPQWWKTRLADGIVLLSAGWSSR